MKLSQKQKLINLLVDGKPHSTIEIMKVCYGDDHLGLARVGARIYDLKKKGLVIVGRRDKQNPAIYWYQLISDVPKGTRHEYVVVDEASNIQEDLFDKLPTSNKLNWR